MVKVDDSTCLQYVQVCDVVGLLRVCRSLLRVCRSLSPLFCIYFSFYFVFKQTYAPLFDCRAQCRQLLSDDCLFMLSQVRHQRARACASERATEGERERDRERCIHLILRESARAR
jgi:hypothetical protein